MSRYLFLSYRFLGLLSQCRLSQLQLKLRLSKLEAPDYQNVPCASILLQTFDALRELEIGLVSLSIDFESVAASRDTSLLFACSFPQLVSSLTSPEDLHRIYSQLSYVTALSRSLLRPRGRFPSALECRLGVTNICELLSLPHFQRYRTDVQSRKISLQSRSQLELQSVSAAAVTSYFLCHCLKIVEDTLSFYLRSVKSKEGLLCDYHIC
jgi:hypothetical protein